MKRSWRSFIAGCLATIFTVALVGSAAAAVGQMTLQAEYNNIQVSLNDGPVNLVNEHGDPVEPFAVDGTTYLPIRAIANAFGLGVSWDGETKTVVLTTPKDKVPVYITQHGKKYHHDSTCNGGYYWEVPFGSAIGMGLEPCEKCVK